MGKFFDTGIVKIVEKLKVKNKKLKIKKMS